MSETSFSLLTRLRLQPDAESWRRLVDLYTPLVQGWLRRHGVAPADSKRPSRLGINTSARLLPISWKAN
jgi:hypothetical protein